MGCTEQEWLQSLPAAVSPAPLRLGDGEATVTLGEGRLLLRWKALPQRMIAAFRLPRLQIGLTFDGVEAAAREAFMRRFDLYMQRGGG